MPISLQGIDASDVAAHAADWEMVALKLRARMMPPVGRPRPDEATYDAVADWLETELDRAAADDLNPGRTTVHRLNRLEYGNAVRDLLGLEIDPEALLPPDDEDEGFDNIADVLSVSPTLMERYLYAARQVSQLAIGDAGLRARFDTYRVPDREIQDDHNTDDLAFGTRGGIAVRHYFPLDGEYNIRVGLRRNFYNYIRGIGNSAHQLDVRLDGALVTTFIAGGGLSDNAERCIASFCGSSGMGGGRVGVVREPRRRRLRGPRPGAGGAAHGRGRLRAQPGARRGRPAAAGGHVDLRLQHRRGDGRQSRGGRRRHRRPRSTA